MAASKDLNATLQELNDDKAVLLIPAIVYTAVLMIVGFIGNILVIIYYGCKAKRTSTSLFISMLAIFDLTACVIAMPGEILDIRYFFMFENVVMCKLSKFVNHLTAAGSSLTLVIVAVDRHRRICFPFRHQIQVKHAFVSSIVCGSVALLLSAPSLIIYAPTQVDIPVPYTSNSTINGKDCTSTKAEQFSLFIWIFNGIYFLIFLLLAFSVTVLYIKIGRVVLKHNRHGAVRTTSQSTTSQTSTNNTVLTDVSTNVTELPGMEQETEIKDNATDNIETMPKEHKRKRSYVVSEIKQNTKIKHEKLDSKTIKCTIIMVAITAAFIISCLPYLALVIWRSFKGGYETEFLSDTELIFFEIGMRSYLLNNAINPILYSFFNDKFRQFIYMSVCPCHHKYSAF